MINKSHPWRSWKTRTTKWGCYCLRNNFAMDKRSGCFFVSRYSCRDFLSSVKRCICDLYEYFINNKELNNSTIFISHSSIFKQYWKENLLRHWSQVADFRCCLLWLYHNLVAVFCLTLKMQHMYYLHHLTHHQFIQLYLDLQLLYCWCVYAHSSWCNDNIHAVCLKIQYIIR